MVSLPGTSVRSSPARIGRSHGGRTDDGENDDHHCASDWGRGGNEDVRSSGRPLFDEATADA